MCQEEGNNVGRDLQGKIMSPDKSLRFLYHSSGPDPVAVTTRVGHNFPRQRLLRRELKIKG